MKKLLFVLPLYLLFILLSASFAQAAKEKIGDDISKYISETESYVLKVPVALYKEPSPGADKIVLTEGATVLLGLDPEGRYCHYIDADDNPWFYILDGNNKLIGWASREENNLITN